MTIQPIHRMMPNRVDAECGVLGSIIIDPEAIIQVSDFLLPGDFYRDAHRTIYDVIVSLYNRREPADFITICDELERRGKLDDVGGASYITSLINQVPTSANVEYYGHIVERASTLRKLIHVGGQIAALGYEEDADGDIALEKAEKLIRAIGNRSRAGQAQDMTEILGEYMTHLEGVSQKQRGVYITGVPSKFRDLDRPTGGFQKGDFIVIGGRPGDGKSALMLDMARQIAQETVGDGFSVLIYSAEMSKEQQAQRALAQETGIDQGRLRVADLEEEDWQLIADGVDRFTPGHLYIDDQPGISIQELCNRAHRHYDEFGCDIIFVDYLQELKAYDDYGKRLEATAEATEVAKGLKQLARELQIPVVALAQLNREVEKRQVKIPQISDLKQSGAIEQEADIVILIYHDPADLEVNGRQIVTLLLAKFRNGPKNPVKVWFEPAQTRFRDIDWNAGVQVAAQPPAPAAPTAEIVPFVRRAARTKKSVEPWNLRRAQQEDEADEEE